MEFYSFSNWYLTSFAQNYFYENHLFFSFIAVVSPFSWLYTIPFYRLSQFIHAQVYTMWVVSSLGQLQMSCCIFAGAIAEHNCLALPVSALGLDFWIQLNATKHTKISRVRMSSWPLVGDGIIFLFSCNCGMSDALPSLLSDWYKWGLSEKGNHSWENASVRLTCRQACMTFS